MSREMIPPTVTHIEDESYPTPKHNQLVYNQPSLIILVEYAVNQLQMKNPIRVLDVSLRCDGAVVTYTEEEKK